MKYYSQDNYKCGKLNDFVSIVELLHVVVSPGILSILFNGRMNNVPTLIEECVIEKLVIEESMNLARPFVNVARHPVNIGRHFVNDVGGTSLNVVGRDMNGSDVNDGHVIPTKW